MNKILQECLVRSAKSVAMPLIGTGKHGFPEDVVLRLMRQEFEKFSMTYPQTMLKEIKLVRFDKGKGRTFQAQPASGELLIATKDDKCGLTIRRVLAIF